MHQDIKNSGLGDAFKIRPMTVNPELAPFLGRVVRHKRELLTEDSPTIKRTGEFLVRETQRDYRGEEILRGYEIHSEDTFGLPLLPNEIEVIR